MRLDDQRESENVGDQRGQSFGGGGGGFGGGGLGMLIGLVGSRFGIGGIVVVVIGMMLFGMNPLSLIGGGGGSTGGSNTAITREGATKACAADASSKFSCEVLGSTEDTWTKLFQAQGAQYRPAGLIFYSGSGSSGCGAAQSAMGPFYCPTDQRIYLDTGFFNELQTKFHATGDFAQAYVIAHEVGHNVQYLDGTAAKVQAGQKNGSEADGNALQVRMELQADCYAGVWAANNKDKMDPGDVEEGLTAAAAIGDDTLQRSAGRTPVPDSFTHGTSAERTAWLKRGLTTGDPRQCDTFTNNIDGV